MTNPCKSYKYLPYKVPELASVGLKFPLGKVYLQKLSFASETTAIIVRRYIKYRSVEEV